ncbi:2-amino-4-oxopentanoate thiolase subunit OrtA [Abyssisolibacter fermentans]|uniref:2-amino-4-oxopentanoate thiolase subunit OrtA n=1 Tax=Abyssisolibacter fermentans TaxID=1766203 RepID=UPI00082D8523|nr:2-amino-4-oxopentanoate thiolase subunit OrtA [Abyssisolibacter fermentans]
MEAKKGDWVRIYNVILTPEQRAPQVPDDTKMVPLEMWDKGFLLDEKAEIGDIVEVETYIGRKIKGKLLEIDPVYRHNYGEFVPELMYVGRQLRALLEAGECDE